MSNCVLFTIPGNEVLANSLIKRLHTEPGEAIIRHFPDGETYVKVNSNVFEKEAIIICSLHQPDDKILPLYFLAKTLKEFRASPVTLVSPYLAYMRRDKRFTDGECISSELFARLLSSFVDKLITIAPHLHRRISLDEIYPIHTSVIHVSHLVSKWINEKIQQPVLIGPDSESEQWVSKVATDANAPYIILEKIRKGDRNVKVSVPQVEKYKEYTPVLVDDIISTGLTMIETIGHLRKAGMRPPVCIGIHAVFAARAYDKLIKAGAEKVVTCNTIVHPSNAIFMDELLAQEICKNSFVVD
ncbi:ribose-phosphate pyrophosphokinase [Hydrotalea sp.]|uniref:ribose-phosphate pyrophosphokinase n=1 Tax=Hydrotalea sp. TaxID=2881279 RepID=UPI0026201945|nr:ribose-phosphate pyrophosphokinase [Hydrotalea sp.]